MYGSVSTTNEDQKQVTVEMRGNNDNQSHKPVVRRGSFTSMQLTVKSLKDHFSEATMNFFVPSRVPLAELKTSDGISGSGKFVVEYHKDERKCNYQMLDVNIRQRIFITMDQITSSYFSMLYGAFISLVVLGSVCMIIMQSFEEETFRPDSCSTPACDNDPDLCPGYHVCEKEIKPVLLTIEFVLIFILGLDYITRIGLCAFVPVGVAGIIQRSDVGKGDVVYPWYMHIFYYAKLPFNVIDLLATLPMVIVIWNPKLSSEQSVFSVALRLFRVGRLMRVMKLPALREGVNMLTNTLKRALPALTLLAVVLLLEMLLFGQLIYIFEKGNYTINEEFPHGAYLRWNADHTAKEESPFSDMFVSMYWAFVTITTVGYGDFYPTSMIGRWVAMLLMFVSVLVVAMPIGVIGGEFSEIYRSNSERKRLHKLKKKEQAQLEASNRSTSDLLAQGDIVSALHVTPSHHDLDSTSTPPLEASHPLETKDAIMERLAVINAQVSSLMLESDSLLQKVKGM